jgi:uncharacterized membrane protein (DUF485 family)
MKNGPDINPLMEDVRCGYQSAVDFCIYEGGLIWARFNAMLVANTLIVTAIGFSLTGVTHLWLLSIVLMVVGMILCWMWFFFANRGYDRLHYWILSARELEQKLSNPAVKTLSRGAEFSAGRPVTFELEGKLQSLQMNRWSRSGSFPRVSLLTPKIFLLIYIAFFVEAVRIGLGRA